MNGIYALGPALSGYYLETVAIPGTGKQSVETARRIVTDWVA